MPRNEICKHNQTWPVKARVLKEPVTTLRCAQCSCCFSRLNALALLVLLLLLTLLIELEPHNCEEVDIAPSKRTTLWNHIVEVRLIGLRASTLPYRKVGALM